MSVSDERKSESLEIQLGEEYALGVCNWENVGLKKPVLYVRTGCCFRKVASFNDMDAVDVFREFCEELVKSVNRAVCEGKVIK